MSLSIYIQAFQIEYYLEPTLTLVASHSSERLPFVKRLIYSVCIITFRIEEMGCGVAMTVM